MRVCSSNKIEGVVLNRVYILGFFVLNRVRVSSPPQLTYTQIFVEYPPPPQESDNTKSTHNVWKKSNCVKSNKGLLCTSHLVYSFLSLLVKVCKKKVMNIFNYEELVEIEFPYKLLTTHQLVLITQHSLTTVEGSIHFCPA